MRCYHDWGLVEVKNQFDPRRRSGTNLRPGDVCSKCGRKRIIRIDWDTQQFSNQPVTGMYKKYSDRSKYLADGRKK